MKSLMSLLFRIFIISLVIYGMYFSFHKIGDDEFILLKNIKADKVVMISTHKYNFIWQGLMPWRYSISRMPLAYTSLLNVKIQIPSLSSLSDEAYLIKIPLSITYKIDTKNLPDVSCLNSRAELEDYLSRSAGIICQAVLLSFIDPVYNKTLIINNEKSIYNEILSTLKTRLNNLGVIIDRVNLVLSGYFPDNRIYSEGLIQNKEMRDLDFSNKKQEIILQKKLLKERYENELYYEKLAKISSMIKENPDLLKFIYIDKLGDNVKIIISSDKTGTPAMFDSNSDSGKTRTKGDIDNLK